MSGTFQCSLHDFSTDNIKEWDEHCAENEHEYDLHIECVCGKNFHIKPKQKVTLKEKRIPRGYKCAKCTKKMMNTPEIKESREVTNE